MLRPSTHYRVILASAMAGLSAVLAADPDRPAEFTITTRLVSTNTPPIGVNEFGDPGGTDYSNGNLIPGAGFEPVSIRRYWRVTQAGSNWVELDAGGVTDWDLVQSGYLSGADFRLYRIVDAAGQPLRPAGNYLDLTRADRFEKVREGRVIAAGTAGNGSDTRDFLLNPPAWTPSGSSIGPAGPVNVRAEAGAGFVRLTWEASPSTNVVGYRVFRSVAPRAAQVNRVYFEGDGPAPVQHDYVVFDRRLYRLESAWSHARVRDVNERVSEVWSVGGSAGDVGLGREPHPGPLPPEFRFPGEGCLRITATNAGSRYLTGPAIFFPDIRGGEALWYGQLEAGRTYRYEAWMRQDGLANDGRVELTFHQMYTGIKEGFLVTTQWQKFGFEFTAPVAPTNGWHGMPRLNLTGPGTLYWWGWGPAFAVHQGGLEFGLRARYVTDYIATRSPHWASRQLEDKLDFVMGSNYQDYAERGRPLAPRVKAIGHAPYVGPKWEIGELYGKSLAMAVAALDAWLGSHEGGFTQCGQLAFSQGQSWSSHTLMNDGFRPHAHWLAIQLRNRFASGQMVRALTVQAPGSHARFYRL